GLMDESGVWPVYHALADAAEAPGAEVLATASSDALRVDATALRAGGRLRLLLANLTRAPQVARVPAAFAGGGLRRLNESSAANASRDPAAWRGAPATERAEATLALAPHEYVRIDSRAK